MKSLDEQIAEHEAAIAKIRIEQDRRANNAPEQNLAETLHETTCRLNHTDMCGWFYEVHGGIHDWEGSTHARYLGRARTVMSLLPDFTTDEIIQVSNALRG